LPLNRSPAPVPTFGRLARVRDLPDGIESEGAAADIDP